MEQKHEKSALLIMIEYQTLAYGILLLTGIILSSFMWNQFLKIGGADINNTLYWLISLFIWIAPQLGLYGSWNLEIEPQKRVQVIRRGVRQAFWLPEGKYVIPFFGLLFTVNLDEIQKTSKLDLKVPAFKSHDKKGEELNLQVTAEKIIDDPTAYAEFDEAEMKEDEKEILSSNLIRTVRSKRFWTEILGQEKALLTAFTKDEIYKRQCKRYGIHFEEIVLKVTIADTSIENRAAKQERIIEDLSEKLKEKTGKLKLTDSDMKEIRDNSQLLMLLSDKTIIQGVSQENIHYRAGDGPKNTHKL